LPYADCGHLFHIQVIEDAKARLRHEILTKLEQAKQKNDHKTVLQFTRLYAPLGLKVPFLPGSVISNIKRLFIHAVFLTAIWQIF